MKIKNSEEERFNIRKAEKLNVNTDTVSRWCTNDSQPSLERLFEIAEVLDVDVAELLVRGKK